MKAAPSKRPEAKALENNRPAPAKSRQPRHAGASRAALAANSSADMRNFMLRACRKRETDLSEAQLYIAPFLSARFHSARLPADKRESITFVAELLAYILR
jgi:hypothetical protein